MRLARYRANQRCDSAVWRCREAIARSSEHQEGTICVDSFLVIRSSYRYSERHTPMDSVTVSPKFQVVIPQRVRERMAVKAGDRMQVVQYGDRIELIPERPARELRGFLAGIDTSVPREEDRV